MKRLAVFILFLTFLPTAFGICDEDWQERSSGLYCYFFNKVNVTFEEAAEECVKRSAQLVDIADGDENTYLFSSSAQTSGYSYWIGIERLISDIWRWRATGTEGQYTKWDVGEPDGEGDCARLTPYGFGLWRDAPCSASLRYICKKHADCGEAEPMPSATISYSQPAVFSNSKAKIYPDQTEATYNCETGYEYLDSSQAKTSKCEIGGIWRPDLVGADTCKPKKCPAPPSYNFVDSNATDAEFYAFNTVIEYKCFDGYWFGFQDAQKVKRLTCAEDKSWKGDDVNHCSEMSCERPVTANSVSNTSSNMQGTVALYRCVTGFKFADGNTSRVFTCGERTWEPPAEKCNIVVCPEHSVEGALPSTPERVYNTRVIWTCERGLQFPDTSYRKQMRCLQTEQWDNVITAKCLRKLSQNNNDFHEVDLALLTSLSICLYFLL